jgi:Kef-type K+ transport system membrane component KefB
MSCALGAFALAIATLPFGPTALTPLVPALTVPLFAIGIGAVINATLSGDHDVWHARIWAALGQVLGAVLLAAALWPVLTDVYVQMGAALLAVVLLSNAGPRN